jgi:hypothetical protein
MRVPAVVGSFPEPFLHGTEGKRFPVRIDCAQDAAKQCDEVSQRLQRAGIDPNTAALGSPSGEALLRVVVGRWEEARHDAASAELEDGPQQSGVFARVSRDTSGYTIQALDARGRVVKTLGAGAGIVAATRFEEQQPTWTVSGTDEAGLERAVRLLDARTLRDRYAIVADGAGPQPLPVHVPATAEGSR